MRFVWGAALLSACSVDAVNLEGKKVVRGGSWRDRPKFCRSGSRLAYPPWQKVYNVGFRVISEGPSQVVTAAE